MWTVKLERLMKRLMIVDERDDAKERLQVNTTGNEGRW